MASGNSMKLSTIPITLRNGRVLAVSIAQLRIDLDNALRIERALRDCVIELERERVRVSKDRLNIQREIRRRVTAKGGAK